MARLPVSDYPSHGIASANMSRILPNPPILLHVRPSAVTEVQHSHTQRCSTVTHRGVAQSHTEV